jgi:hypothetical protein
MPRVASWRAADAGARMTVRMLRWATGCVAAISVALLVGGIALSYVDRHMGPLSRWDFSNVFEEAAFIAVPAVGFVLASRRPGNRVGWISSARAWWWAWPSSPTGTRGPGWSRRPGQCREPGRPHGS